MRSRLSWLAFALAAFLFVIGTTAAQQNNSGSVKSVPPPGIEVPAAERAELEAGIAALGKEIDGLSEALKKQPALLTLLPDVQIFHNAARYALQYNEFFKPEEIATAKRQLKQGMERAAELRAGKASWTTQTGLIVRGYVSDVDGSVQPYGLVVPPTYQPNLPHQYRLDVWFHGRGDTLSEVNFLADRQKNAGQFTPPNTIVLHPYGRYNCANKFAGEVDLFEALDKVKQQYRVDENRILVRGFSMGGAATWQFGVHFAGQWAAIAPGAGFSESAQFLKLKMDGPEAPPWWEQKLFHLYDATDYAANLFNTPLVAYNGENDGQKQAADMMEKALAAEGARLLRIVGPKTGHSYHPDSKVEIDRILDAIAERGRDPPLGSHCVVGQHQRGRHQAAGRAGLAPARARPRLDAATDRGACRDRGGLTIRAAPPRDAVPPCRAVGPRAPMRTHGARGRRRRGPRAAARAAPYG